ncbi:hypothetical protein P9112_006332 [Eukaryota sp. TZLM1-RC]
MFQNNLRTRKIVKSKIFRKLCLRGRYGTAKQSLFSSSLADANSDTLEKLQKLHPQENFKCSKPDVCPFWIENPITSIEVLKAIQKLPKGKAAGPSGISFDLLKIACCSAPEIADDLAHYFQQLIVLKINPASELLATRLIALVKPGNGIKPDGIRPIAVGESLSRFLASIVFDRVKDKASEFLNPHQFGIKTIDGASVAAIASDTFVNAEENNFIFSLLYGSKFQRQEDGSSDGFYKLLTRTRSLTSNQWTFIHSSSSLPYGAKHEKSRPNTRLRVETPPPLLLYYNAKILLFCRSCKAKDTLRPPVKIPVEVRPASSIPLSIELRSFTSKLKKNEWDVSSFWKFFAKKKSFVNKNAVYKQNPIPKVTIKKIVSSR